MAFSVGTLRHARLRDVSTPHVLADLVPAVASEAEVDGRISTHAGFPDVHHAQLHQATHASGGIDAVSLDASQVTTGRFPLARMPDGVSGQVLTGQGIGVEPTYADPVIPANCVNVMVEAIMYG